MSNSVDVLDAALAAASAIGGGKKDGNQEGKLPLVFLSEKGVDERIFTARIVWDKNKRIHNTFYMYSQEIPEKNEKGETEMKRVRYRVPPGGKQNDPLAPLAAEFVDDYTMKAQYYDTYFCEIITVAKGQTAKFKPGPCVLIANNYKFWKAFETSMNMAKMIESNGQPTGKIALLQTLSPEEKGFPFGCTWQKGTGGTISIQFNGLGYGEPTHELNPEYIEKFDDITIPFCPPLDDTNTSNGLKLQKYYDELIKNKAHTASADTSESAAALKKAMVEGKPQKTTKQKLEEGNSEGVMPWEKLDDIVDGNI